MSNFNKFEDEFEFRGDINLNQNENFKEKKIENKQNEENSLEENRGNFTEENSSGFVNFIINRLNFIGKYFNLKHKLKHTINLS